MRIGATVIIGLGIIPENDLTPPARDVLLSVQATRQRVANRPPATQTETATMTVKTLTTRNFKTFRNHVTTASTGSDNGNKYYGSVGEALGAIDSKCIDYSCRVDPDDWASKTNRVDFSDPNGCSVQVECVDFDGSHQCDLMCGFYRMPSGRYELTVYAC